MGNLEIFRPDLISVDEVSTNIWRFFRILYYDGSSVVYFKYQFKEILTLELLRRKIATC